MRAAPFMPARPADEVCGPARRGRFRRLGIGLVLAFTLKGLASGSLILVALLQLTGD